MNDIIQRIIFSKWEVILMADSKKTLVVRIDETLHKEMKIHVISKGITIKEYIETLIKEDMKSNK